MKQKIITLDAKGQPLGRLASKVALILQGKNSPSYAPNRVADVKVRVKNVSEVEFTGKKLENKVYKWHTGYLGHLKVAKMSGVFAKKPEEVLKRAVAGMLPKNRLLKERMKNLSVEK